MDTLEELARQAFEPKLNRPMTDEEAAEYAMHVRRFAAFLIDCRYGRPACCYSEMAATTASSARTKSLGARDSPTRRFPVLMLIVFSSNKSVST